jgi:hypothetical protein
VNRLAQGWLSQRIMASPHFEMFLSHGSKDCRAFN